MLKRRGETYGTPVENVIRHVLSRQAFISHSTVCLQVCASCEGPVTFYRRHVRKTILQPAALQY
jgi:hypothetical protein